MSEISEIVGRMRKQGLAYQGGLADFSRLLDLAADLEAQNTELRYGLMRHPLSGVLMCPWCRKQVAGEHTCYDAKEVEGDAARTPAVQD